MCGGMLRRGRKGLMSAEFKATPPDLTVLAKSLRTILILRSTLRSLGMCINDYDNCPDGTSILPHDRKSL